MVFQVRDHWALRVTIRRVESGVTHQPLTNLLFYAGAANDLLTEERRWRRSPLMCRKVRWRVKEFARSLQTEGDRKKPAKDLGLVSCMVSALINTGISLLCLVE